MAIMIHEFTIITDATHLDDLPIDELYEAGCADGSPTSGGGVAYVAFFREAETREDAIATAARDVTRAFAAAGSPYRVTRVEGAGYSPFEDRRTKVTA